VTLTYDNNGNLTFDGTFTYGYDAENRLISAVGAGNTASYAYDPQGRRKSKTVNGTTTIFVQDPQGRALLDYDGTSGTIQNWYAFGSGPNDVLNQINVAGSTRATYIPDVQGSIVASLDANSGTLTKAGYQSYGESSTTAGTFRFTGARIDAETNGLYDFRARVYSPAIGRFLQMDPIGTAGGVNLYAYVNNDPLNLIVLLGFCPSCTGPNTSPEPGLGNGGEITLFNIGLAVATLGFSIPEQVGVGAARSGFSLAEQGVINEARTIVTSPQMADLAASNAAGVSLSVNVGSRLIQFEPGLPASGMTMFGENGFLMGPEAFSSNLENSQTVLHELYRLTFSNSAGGVSGALATQETNAAASFAARAAGQLP
jgi:RHS repeat-associated protein